jgi:hypothetical protein
MRWPSERPSIRISTSRIFATQTAASNLDEIPCKKLRLCNFAKNFSDRQRTDEARVAEHMSRRHLVAEHNPRAMAPARFAAF